MPVRANSSKMLEVIAGPIDIITEQVERCTKAGLQLKVIDIQETTLCNLAATYQQLQSFANAAKVYQRMVTVNPEKAETG